MGLADTPLTTRGIAVRLFITCWVIFAMHFATNSVRELFPAMSVGERLSVDVSEYAGMHPDLFEMERRGWFINNNPGASFVGAVPYAAAAPVVNWAADRVKARRAATGAEAPVFDSPWPLAREFHRKAFARGLDIKLGLGAAVTQAFGMAVVSALAVVVMFHVLRVRIGSDRTAAWLAVLYAMATPMLYRTAQLNQNLMVAHCALVGFVLLWRPWDAGGAARRPRYLLAGLLCGYAVVCDYSGLVVVLVLGIYAVIRWAGSARELRRWVDLPLFGVGLVVCALVLMGYQWVCFGHPIKPAQFYMPPPEHGYPGMGWPEFELMWRTMFDPRYGLFVAAPLLGLMFVGMFWPRGDRRLMPRREGWVCVAFAAAMLLFCSANSFGYIQYNSGVRHVVPAAPFVFLLAAGVLAHMPRGAAIAIGVVCTGWTWCGAMVRDVEMGRGILEGPLAVVTGGPRLPWLTTLERMGYVSGGIWATVVIVVVAAFVGVLWRVRFGGKAEAVAAA
ncbi:MAG: hypothetical protein CMJ49_06285 [Planctomycetaceae bacterium]|nr:hypothetical protein [Planctomycetaceae bacterium]